MSATQWLLDPGFGPVVFAAHRRRHRRRRHVAVMAGLAQHASARNTRADHRRHRHRRSGSRCRRVFDREAIEHLGDLRPRRRRHRSSASPSATRGAATTRACRPAPAALTAFLIGGRHVRRPGDAVVGRVLREPGDPQPADQDDRRPARPRLEGDFWVIINDTFSHLMLPTLALMLISLAAYTRYSRASMLEVLNQDYIRTARAKGLTERTVVVRHALPQRADPAGDDRRRSTSAASSAAPSSPRRCSSGTAWAGCSSTAC